MSNFAFPAGTPTGVVPSNYVLPSTDYSTVINQLVKAPNFTDGSTHAPSAFITVGGSGFELTGTAHSLAASARLSVESTGEIRLKNGALLRADGSVADIRLEVDSNVAKLTVEDPAQFILSGVGTINGDVTWTTAGSGTATWQSGATATFASGSTLTASSGSTVTLAGATTLSGNTTVSGAATISASGSLQVANGATVTGVSGSSMSWIGQAGFSGAVTFLSGATLTGNSGATGSWASAWSFGSTLAVTGAVTCSSTLAVTGAATLSNTLAVTGQTTFNARVERVGTTAYESLRIKDGPDSSTTIDGTEGDVWNAPITSDRTWTLSNGPANKAFTAHFAAPNANTLTLASTGFSITMSRVALSGDYKVVTVLWTGTEWLHIGGITV